MKVCWVLSDAFSTSVEMTMWVFSSVQLMQYITLIFFFFFPLHWTILTFWEQIPLGLDVYNSIFCWTLFATVLLRFFFFISVQMSNWSVVFLSLSDFSIRELLPSQSELGSVPAYSVWKVWRIVFGRIHQWNHLTLAFSWDVFCYWFSLLPVKGLFRFSFPFWITLYISRNLLFHLDCLLVYNSS